MGEIVQGAEAAVCSQDRTEVCGSHEEKERGQQRIRQEEVHSGAEAVPAHLRCAAGAAHYYQVTAQGRGIPARNRCLLWPCVYLAVLFLLGITSDGEETASKMALFCYGSLV